MMEWVLRANRFEMMKEIDDQEQTILSVAAGEWNLDRLTAWLRERVKEVQAFTRTASKTMPSHPPIAAGL